MNIIFEFYFVLFRFYKFKQEFEQLSAEEKNIFKNIDNFIYYKDAIAKQTTLPTTTSFIYFNTTKLVPMSEKYGRMNREEVLKHYNRSFNLINVIRRYFIHKEEVLQLDITLKPP